MAKSRTVHCRVCGNSYYTWGKKDRECPLCEEVRFKESNPETYKKWKAVKTKNDDMSRKICNCNNLVNSIKRSLIISLPVLIFLYVGIINAYKDGNLKEELESISMPLIISVMLIWTIKIGLMIYRNDHSVYEVWTKGGEYLGDEVGNRFTIPSVITVGIILTYLTYKFYIKSGTDGYITRQCIVGLVMLSIESLMTGVKLILAIKAKISVVTCRKQIISLAEFKKYHKAP